MRFSGIGISPGNGGLTTLSGGRFRPKCVARDNGHRRGPRRAAIWARRLPPGPACTLALHLGIEMPKPLMTRWMIGVAFAAVAVLGIASVWQARSAGDNQPGRSAVGEPSGKPRRQQELRFLKAAFDRLEAEAKQNPNSPALRSLQAEQQAVVLRMREVAHPLRAESVPEEVRALVGAAPALTTASVGTRLKPSKTRTVRRCGRCKRSSRRSCSGCARWLIRCGPKACRKRSAPWSGPRRLSPPRRSARG